MSKKKNLIGSSMPPAATCSDADHGVNHHAQSFDDPLAEFSDAEYQQSEEDDDDEGETEVEEEEEEEEMPVSPEETKEKCRDFSQEMALQRNHGSNSTREISELSLPSNSLAKNGVHMQIKGSYVNHGDTKYSELQKNLVISRENQNMEPSSNKKGVEALTIKKNTRKYGPSLRDSYVLPSSIETMVAETTDPCSITGKRVAMVLSTGDSLVDEANPSTHSSQEVKPMNMHLENAKEQIVSRLVASGTQMQRVSSPSEFMDRKKRPAVICAFFANGWCIRGSACKFLHINNKADDGDQLPEGDNKISFLQKDDISQGISSLPRLYSSPKDAPGASSSSKDVEIENHSQNWTATDYGHYAALVSRSKSLFQNSLHPEHQTCLNGSFVRSSNYQSANGTSYLSSLEDVGCMRSVHHSSLDTSLSGSITLPSLSMSAWTGSLFSCNSLNRSRVHSRKQLDSDRDYHASVSSSFLQSISPFSGSQVENKHPTSFCGDHLCCTQYKAEISSNDWEPSIPFQPSVFITPGMTLTPGSQYDPLRDTFELANVGDKSLKFSFSQGKSILNATNQPTYGDSSLSPFFGTECNGEKSTISSRNGIVPKEESASGTNHEKGIPSRNKSHVDARHQINVSRLEKNKREDQVRQSNDIEVDQKSVGNVQKEFRSALVDFVKELLKPAWREGHLSKDAHIKIVKKCVEKVLSTLELHQMPNTVELIKLYLSSSRPKIAKLVEGYCKKYGKS